MGKAFGDWLAAKSGVRIMKENIEKIKVEEINVEEIKVEEINVEKINVEEIKWEEVHAYMANMGYFVVDFSDEPDSKGKNER